MTAITPQMFGAVGDGVTDDAPAFNAAIATLNGLGGGALYVPRSRYRVASPIPVCRNLIVYGDGKMASALTSSVAGTGASGDGARSGSIFASTLPINASTALNFVLRDIGLENLNPANVGAGYYDQGGSFVQLRNVRFAGFKRGVILDQTELADIDSCDFEFQGAQGLWLVNGQELNASAGGFYTNRISVARCQFNEGPTVHGILDDGGTSHTFQDNNYNGCLNHIRAAGVQGGLNINGGEFESAAGHNIVITYTRLSGGGVGQCVSTSIVGTAQSAHGANSCVAIESANFITIHDNALSAVTPIIGVANAGDSAIWNNPGGAGDDGADSYATYTWRPTLYAAAAPASRYWRKGQIVFNNNPAAGGTAGWRCIASGSPGTWEVVRWA